ncbi:hypothetical protein [Demequina litorisediminis]|uniref:hypothetical protein n=1 Tax=Demequina litorisediminis TaxID=1849022 RepID=UPI0024E163B1|nr:hypothetical protein [Demequina litorisediminis]
MHLSTGARTLAAAITSVLLLGAFGTTASADVPETTITLGKGGTLTLPASDNVRDTITVNATTDATTRATAYVRQAGTEESVFDLASLYLAEPGVEYAITVPTLDTYVPGIYEPRRHARGGQPHRDRVHGGVGQAHLGRSRTVRPDHLLLDQEVAEHLDRDRHRYGRDRPQGRLHRQRQGDGRRHHGLASRHREGQPCDRHGGFGEGRHQGIGAEGRNRHRQSDREGSRQRSGVERGPHPQGGPHDRDRGEGSPRARRPCSR